MILSNELNAPQEEAVRSIKGPVLVLAGAGSGKTRVLTYRVAHLIKEHGVSPEQILAFTFTNKAAGEMKLRLQELLPEGVGGLWVGTFHSTGVRILRRFGPAIGIERGFSIWDTDDTETALRRILKTVDGPSLEITPRAARSVISTAKNQLLTPKQYASQASTFREEKLARIYAEYAKRLRASHALDFDDLILEPIRLLSEHEDIRSRLSRRFEYVLVDEYQDTNPAQSRLINLLARDHGNIFVVGDDDQSIYGWRGADIRHILSFEDTWPGAKVIRLEQNYRSTKTILEAANSVVSHNQYRNPKKLWTEGERGDLIGFLLAQNEDDEARNVAARVLTEQRAGTPLSDMAVMYRTNAQSRSLESAFRSTKIPYQLVGGVAFYQRKEIKDLVAYLRLMVNPRDNVAFQRVLNVPKRGIGTTTWERLLVHADREGKSLYESLGTLEDAPEFKSTARKRLLAFHGVMEILRRRLEDPVDAVIVDLVEKLEFFEHLKNADPVTAEDRIENVRELAAGAQLFAERSEDVGTEAFLNEISLLTNVDEMEDAAEKIPLMTIHNSKGLEFKVVLAPGLEEGLLPHSSSQDTEEELEEERRLFYVCLTRAKERIWLFSARSRIRWGGGSGSLVSRFVEEIPDSLLRIEETPSTSWGSSPAYSEPRRSNKRLEPMGSRHSLGVVLHPRFGRGDVLSQEGQGPEARLEVLFEGNIRKKIIARYAQWEEYHADI